MARFELRTERLWLRPCAPADVPALEALWNEPGVYRYLFDGEPPTRALVEEVVASSLASFEASAHGLWCVLRSAGGPLVGCCGYRHFHEPPVLELMYSVASACWGQGYATEAARALAEYGFRELGMTRVLASTDGPNAASVRVMERLGMRFERRTPDGHFGETLHYALGPPGGGRLTDPSIR